MGRRRAGTAAAHSRARRHRRSGIMRTIIHYDELGTRSASDANGHTVWVASHRASGDGVRFYGMVPLRAVIFALFTAVAPAATPFWIHVIDQETGRGVPLVQLSTPRDAVRFWTDSNGVAAIDDAALAGHDVIFSFRSHGYEFQERIFDEPAKRLHVEPGNHVEVKVRRVNIAERLYRVTGADIYRDSVLAGLPVPTADPLLSGGVTGQDTNISIPYQGKVFWCYGDTFGLAAAIFSASCATSQLPGKGGLDPEVGVNLTYFVDAKGFSRNMLPLPRPGLVWIEGLFTVKDPAGRERLALHSTPHTPP